MKCPRCHSDNRETASFCSQCGQRLESCCPSCGNPLPPGAKFCDACGRCLEPVTEKGSSDYIHFSSQSPKYLRDTLVASRSSLEGERKFVTVLFADVADYTAFSERLDPEEVHQIMDGCFKVLADEILRYEGTVIQFTGDGAIALFGAPVSHEDHAQRACYASLSIQKAIDEFAERMKTQYGIRFRIRIGLNSGLVLVGSIGEDLQVEYTAIGDTTNVACRMETMARPGAILVSQSTYRLVKGFFEFKPVGKVSVKGKEDEMEAYELLTPTKVVTRIEAAAVRGLTKFVGREKELASLKSVYEKVKSGSGQVIGIVGEAGVGKSRLILELQSLACREECHYLEGRCLRSGTSTAYLPLLDVLRSYFDITEGSSAEVIQGRMKERVLKLDEKLTPVLPSLYELFSLPVEDDSFVSLDPKLKRERTFEAIRDLLIRESQRLPLVLAFEDLHWVDKTSEEFLSYLMGWLANTRILLILLHRPEYTHSWGSKSYFNRLGLDELSPEVSVELVKTILAGEVDPAVSQWIISKAGGNPLFIEELTRTLLENGFIVKAGDRYAMSKKASAVQMPDTIQGIIASRVDRLEENLKRTLQVASVIGKDFGYRVLLSIVGADGAIKSYLFKLQELEFIYERSLFPELEYVFKHALVQEVAYSSLLLRRRKEIHEKIGRAIEVLYAERLEELYETLAYHFSKSRDRESAYKYLKLAGLKATRNYSLWEAFRFYRDAIDALNELPETPERNREQVELRLLMTSCMISLGFPEDSLQILQQGERIARAMRDEKNLTTLCSVIGLYFSVKGDPIRGIKYGERCLRMAEKLQDIDVTAPVAFDLVSNYASRGQFLKVTKIAPSVLTKLEEAGKQHDCFDRGYNVYSALAGFYGWSLAYTGNFEEAKVLCEKAVAHASQPLNLSGLGLAELMFGFSYTTKGDGKNAISHFENSIKCLEKGQIFVLLGLAWSGLGWSYHFMGDNETAHLHIEKGLNIQKGAGISYDLSVSYWFLSQVCDELGHREEALKYAEEALRLSRKNHERFIEGESLLTLGRMVGKLGRARWEEAESHIRQGIKILGELKLKTYWSTGYLFLAELLAYQGQREEALKIGRKAIAMLQECGMDYFIEKALPLINALEAKK